MHPRVDGDSQGLASSIHVHESVSVATLGRVTCIMCPVSLRLCAHVHPSSRLSRDRTVVCNPRQATQVATSGAHRIWDTYTWRLAGRVWLGCRCRLGCGVVQPIPTHPRARCRRPAQPIPPYPLVVAQTTVSYRA